MLKFKVFYLFFVAFFCCQFFALLNAAEYSKNSGLLQTVSSKGSSLPNPENPHFEKIVYQNKYITNPYRNNNNNYSNSLIISAGGVNGFIQPLYRYSNSEEYSSSNLNKLSITTNYNISYLRKVSDKLSVGVEFGMFSPSTAAINNESVESNSKSAAGRLNPEDRLFLGSGNLCDSLSQGVNSQLQTMCNNSSSNSVTTCDFINNANHLGIRCQQGNNNLIDSDFCAQWSYYCNNGMIVDGSNFCSNLAKLVFGNENNFKGVYSSGKCQFQPVIIPFACDPSSAAHDQSLCQKPDPGPCEASSSCFTPPPPPPSAVCDPSSPDHDQSLCQNPDTGPCEASSSCFTPLVPPPSAVCDPNSPDHDQSLCEKPDLGPCAIDNSCYIPPECMVDPSLDICKDPDLGVNNNSQPKRVSITSNSYTAMFLANYELYRKNKVGFAIECGFGGVYREMALRGDVSGKGQDVALAGKVGVVGSYFITDNFALGIGTHYVYMGETNFKALGKTDRFQGYDFNMKTDRTITYNLQLRYLF
ncbi:MAG: hypothetical protein FWE18_06410 [Alphaproteobacteria bacterium]|nr:hypothetical protein [Alphaproteobacteria bacterium]